MSSIENVCNMSPTINSKDFAHFKKLSTHWWHDTLGIKSLHAMNNHRVPFIRDGLFSAGQVANDFIETSTPLKDIQILEVGCGGGILSEALARIGSSITGIDINADLIEVAKQHASVDATLSKLRYHVESIEEHALANPEKYDAVVASEVVEHVNEQELFLESCVKCLKPGGSIFITTINKTTASWLGAIIAAEYIFNFIPRGTHQWDKFVTPEQMQKVLESYKCGTRLVRGHYYNVLTGKWFWTTSTATFYLLHAVKENITSS